MSRNTLVDLLAYALAGLFFYSSIGHLRTPYRFLIDVSGYEFDWPWLNLLAAGLIPSLEFAIATCLISRNSRRVASVIGTLLLLAFSVLHLYVTINEMDVECACFGASDEKVSYYSFLRNLALLALSCALTYSVLRNHVRRVQ